MLLDILGQFLATQFPDWGRCYLSLNPREKTLRLYCPTIQSRFAIAQDQGKLSALDIGIHKIVVIHDEQPDFIIKMKPCVRIASRLTTTSLDSDDLSLEQLTD